MANHLNFLLVLDEHVRDSPLGYVSQGIELYPLSWSSGLVAPPDQAAARWTGQLVSLGYVEFTNSIAPAPARSVAWTDRELQEHYGYTVTAAGHGEADRARRREREQSTDAALGRGYPVLDAAWLTDVQREAIARPLRDLRAALDSEGAIAAIGHARELAETACRLVIHHTDQPEPGTRDSLAKLFSSAAGGVAGIDRDLGRSMSAVAQRLGELRNSIGSGHGTTEVASVGIAEARLAASAACCIAAYLLAVAADP